MSALLWRVIIAVVCCVILYALLPPFFRIVGFSASGDVLLILRVCIAWLAVLYVIKGPPFRMRWLKVGLRWLIALGLVTMARRRRKRAS